MRNVNIFTIISGCLIALVTAVIIRVLLPIPIITGFALLSFLLAIQIVEARFGSGLKVAKDWITASARTGMGVIIFLALRFLVGQLLGLYPTDQYGEWGKTGIHGLFWGHDASRTMIWEVLFAFIGGGISFAWSRGNPKAQKFVGLVFFLSFMIVTAQVALPNWAAKWPTIRDADMSLASDGIQLTITGSDEDRYLYPQLQAEVTFIVPVGTGSTEWIMRPERATLFSCNPEEKVGMEIVLVTGERVNIEYDPLKPRVPLTAQIRAMRFTNESGKEVKAKIKFVRTS